MTLHPDTLVHGRYRIVRLIGAGGFGTVYEAIDERLNHRVAIKQLMRVSERIGKQFTNEARLLANLHHPSLPRVTDHFSESDGPFLVMDYVPGDDLATVLYDRNAPFPVDEVLGLGYHLLDVLHFLHTRQPPIIHRDIKPQNLKMQADGSVMLLDFGLAKGHAGEVQPPSTASSIAASTRGFAPPEQVEGTGTDARSDLYALSATMYCLLTNTAPPEAQSRLLAVMRSKPDPLKLAHVHNPQVPEAISAVLQQAMALEKDDRPADAQAMRVLLDAARSGVVPISLGSATVVPGSSAPTELGLATDTSPTVIDLPVLPARELPSRPVEPVAAITPPLARPDLREQPAGDQRPNLDRVALWFVLGAAVLGVGALASVLYFRSIAGTTVATANSTLTPTAVPTRVIGAGGDGNPTALAQATTTSLPVVVPPLPTPVPTAIPTFTSIPSPTPVPTATPVPPATPTLVPTETPLPTATELPTPTESPRPTATVAESLLQIARTVVLDFFAAINARDYSTAYSYLGTTFQQNQPYNKFESGFSTTAQDDVEIVSVQQRGEQYAVNIRLIAYQTDGSVQRFSGSYFVGREYGVWKIISAQVRAE